MLKLALILAALLMLNGCAALGFLAMGCDDPNSSLCSVLHKHVAHHHVKVHHDR